MLSLKFWYKHKHQFLLVVAADAVVIGAFDPFAFLVGDTDVVIKVLVQTEKPIFTCRYCRCC